ncbi:MAG: hypothetical protein QHH15_05120 [Candidatus Thermoplasmatota archaeon]|jgi:signal recognition particle subunit SEC65|nr:hypothetical protein [Candidatus Thermoplasmatota archaeon]
MSIKKELLTELTLEQLKELAENKGIKFKLSETQKNYYANWNEKDMIVDLMVEKEALTVKDIENFIKSKNNL